MDNRKNTILLTVIAVATLLVAVVGATFAYFTAQGGTTSTANATVRTETADSATFATNELALTADQDSFAAGKGNAAETATGSAKFTANSSAESSLCYTVKVKFSALATGEKGFSYRPADTPQPGTEDKLPAGTDPELLLTISKGRGEATKAEITTAITGLTHKTGVKGANDTDATAVSGYDITSVNATGAAEFTIPDENGKAYHKITAAAGATLEDKFDFKVTLVNYNWDQNYNAGSTLNGKIEFVKMDTCPTD